MRLALKLKQCLVSLLVIFSANVNSDLIFDGIPDPTGVVVGDASAALVTGIAQFYESLAAWERVMEAGDEQSEDERKSRASSSFESAQGWVNKSIDLLTNVLDSTDEETMDALSQSVASPGDLTLQGQSVLDILKRNNIEEPQTYEDVVEIARVSAELVRSSMNEYGFSPELREFRNTAAELNSVLSEVVLVGLAVGAYSIPE